MQAFLVAPNIEPVSKVTKNLPVNAYSNSFYIADVWSYYTCREQFHDTLGIKKADYVFSTDDVASLSIMFDWAESKLNLKDRSAIRILSRKEAEDVSLQPMGNNIPNMVYLHLSDFWKSENIRFYFSTVLCRAARVVAWNHPLEAIEQTNYCQSTPRATALFLDGNTILNNGFRKTQSNWVQLFTSGKNTSDLCRPTEEKDLQYFVDNNPTPNLTPYEKNKLMNWVRLNCGLGLGLFSW